jgi:hypothetical protein
MDIKKKLILSILAFGLIATCAMVVWAIKSPDPRDKSIQCNVGNSENIEILDKNSSVICKLPK